MFLHIFLNTPIPKRVFKRLLENNRNLKLINYLFDFRKNKMQDKSSKIRRLYVELASDDRNIIISLIYRINEFLLNKLRFVN